MDVKIVENPIIETILNLLEEPSSTINIENSTEIFTTSNPSLEPSSRSLENSTTTSSTMKPTSIFDENSTTNLPEDISETTTTTTKKPTTDKKVYQLRSSQNIITIDKILISIIYLKTIYFT